MSREISVEALPGWLVGKRVKDALELQISLLSSTEDRAPQFATKLWVSPESFQLQQTPPFRS